MQSTFDLKFNLLQFKVLQCIMNVQVMFVKQMLNGMQLMIKEYKNDPKNETIIYNNPNALTGFLTLTSISFEIQINFKIEIIRHIKYQQFEANRLSNHFRIILCIQLCLIHYSYIARQIFITPYLGFNLTPNEAINLYQSQDLAKNPGNLVYKIYEQPGDTYFLIIFHQKIWISKTFSTVFQSFRQKKIQITQKQYLDQNIQSIIQLKFDQESQIFNNNGNYRILLDKTKYFINVFFSLICEQDKKKQIEFFYFREIRIVYNLNILLTIILNQQNAIWNKLLKFLLFKSQLLLQKIKISK